MNIQTLSDIADKKIQLSDGAFKTFRESQLDLFRKNGFQSPVVDAYKFTHLASFFEKLTYEPHEGSAPVVKASPFPTIVFQDGELLRSDVLPEGVELKRVKDLSSLDFLKESNALSHLHHSLIGEGVVIEVAKNVELESPLRILNLLTKNTITAPTHLIVANPFSKLTVIEETLAQDIAHAQVTETYLYAHPGSKVEHIFLDQEGPQGINHSSVYAEVEQDASVKSFIFNTAGRLNRKNLVLDLNSSGANGESYALFLTNGEEHSDVNTVINHRAADTTSAQIAKGILDGDSKAVFTGKIHIFPKAQRVASSQLNKNLLLSKRAHVHSQPQLEIFADDVKCSHGSTTGQLSDDEVFYFEARGIPANRAKTLLAQGFGLEVVLKIENQLAREHVNQVVLDKLIHKFHLGGSHEHPQE
jgi:Fe-S cluster assembly protein SufD